MQYSYNISKLIVVQEINPYALAWDLFLVAFLHIWAYKHGCLARRNKQ